MSFAKIRPRRGTASQWTSVNPVLMLGEEGIEVPDSGIGTGKVKIKYGDGVTRWNDLPYGVLSGLSEDDIVNDCATNRSDKVASAMVAKALQDQINTNEELLVDTITNGLKLDDIVNNAVTDNPNKVVSASVAKDLQDQIINTNTDLVNTDHRVSLLEARTKILDTNVVETKTFDIFNHGTYLLFCQSASKEIFAIYYINVGSDVIATVSGDNSWSVSISDDKTKLNVSNAGFVNHPWGHYVLHSIGW